MHDAICATCGDDCQVPFKPTFGKQVYCSNCFRKDSSPRSSSSRGTNGLEEINQKLDKIMRALKI
mgnify:CR=1 FL=1